MKKVICLSLFCFFITTGVCLAAAPPKLIEVIPPNNSTDVPPDVGELVFFFDRAMKMNSWSLMKHPELPFPPVINSNRPWEDEFTFVLKLKALKPGVKYAVILNSVNKKGFAAADDGSPLPVTTIIFTAAGAGQSGAHRVTPPDKPQPAPVSPQGNQGKTPVKPGTPLAGASMGQNKKPPLIFQKVTEPRERAFTILAPKGWITEGGIFRVSAAAAGGPGNAIGAKCDFTIKKDQAGTVRLRYHPDINYAAGMAAASFPQGSNYAGMEVKHLMNAQAYLRALFQYLHPKVSQVKIVKERRLTETLEAYNKALAPVNYNLQRIGLPAIGLDAAKLVVDYNEGGIDYREELATGIVDMTRISASWNNSRTYSLRAPVGEFEYWRRVLAISHESIKIDQKWLAGELRGQDQRAGQVVKVMHEIQRIEREITASRQKTNAEIMHDNYLCLTGQEDYVNPYTNEVEQDTSDYRYRWVTPEGDRVYTDDENFNPNLVSNRTDFKLTPVRQ